MEGIYVLYTVVTLLPRLGIYSLCIQPASEVGHTVYIHLATKTNNILYLPWYLRLALYSPNHLRLGIYIFIQLPEAGNIFPRWLKMGIQYIHQTTWGWEYIHQTTWGWECTYSPGYLRLELYSPGCKGKRCIVFNIHLEAGNIFTPTTGDWELIHSPLRWGYQIYIYIFTPASRIWKQFMSVSKGLQPPPPPPFPQQ